MILKILCCVLFVAGASAAPGEAGGATYSYREDYVYNSKTDAFYKMHPEPVPWARAKEVCTEEKASLLGHGDGDVIFGHSLMKKFPDVASEVFISNDGKIHKDESEREESEEDYQDYRGRRRLYDDDIDINMGNGMCNVLTMRGKLTSVGCYNSRPFICKVARVDLHYNEDCKVFDTDFKYNATLGSCYKIKATPYTWGQALASCVSEGAHLVVINSQAEADFLKSSIMGLAVRGATRSQDYFWHVGFRSHPEAGDPVYRTIFNQTLAEAGFDKWSPGEPNNYMSREHCGSFFRNTAKLNDIVCDNLHGFICEKETQKS